jgi:hypothetical protein
VIFAPQLLLVGSAVAAVVLAGSHWWAYSKGGDAAYLEVAEARIESQQRALEAVAQVRTLEAELQAVKTKAEEDSKREKAANARALAAHRADADRMRGDIAAYAAGGASAASVAACGARTTALGALLDSALRASSACAADGESLSSDLRAVLGAWPKVDP